MKLAVLLTGFALLLCAAGFVISSDRANLSGSWVMDKDKSFNRRNGPGVEKTMTFTHTGDTVKLEAKQKSPSGEVEIKEDYTLDGKEAEFTPQGAPPNQKGKRKATWLPNGRGILVEDEITADGKVVRQLVRKMSLSTDGKVLTVDIFIDDNRGSFEIKRVYNKVG
jgi:hypothetical protein